MRVYVVRRWPLRGRSRCVCWNMTGVNLRLCAFRAMYAKDPPTDKNIRGWYSFPITTWPCWPKGTDHCRSEEYRCTHVDGCVARTWISYRCVPCHPWCTHRTSNIYSCQKESFFSFPEAVNNSIKAGPLVFLL